MKLLALVAAGLVATAIVPVADAGAQTRTRVVHASSRHVVAHRGRHAYWRNVCRTTWRHHRKVRTCHRVRAWR